jgi:glycosyltransferase involved in cell wall biosynthesis
MRTMVIGHSYCAPINHQKLRVLAARFPGRIRVVTPRSWRDMLRTVSTAAMPEPKDYDLSPIPISFNGRESVFLYHQVRLASLMARDRPELIHISQDPRMLSCGQAVATARRVLGHSCRIVVVAQENDLSVRVRALNQRSREYVLDNIDYLIAGNPGALELARSIGYQGPGSVLSHFGVDTGQFSPEAGRQREGRDLRIGYIGRFVWYKGIDTLINASAILPVPHQLVLVGRGPYRHSMLRQLRQLRMERLVEMRDSVAAEHVPALLRDLDIAVLPTTCMEQFGRVLIEAMSCGVPVVGSDAGSIPWVVGDAGMIFRKGDHHDLSGALAALGRDRELRQRFGISGRDRVLKEFSYDVVGRSTLAIWEQITGSLRMRSI